jgi:hypothetical protein
MSLLGSKPLWLGHLLTIALCAFFAAKSVGHYAAAQLPISAPVVRSGPVPPQDPPPTPREIEPILERNIFCSSCERTSLAEAAPLATDPATAAGRPLVRTTLAIKLIATVISEENPDLSFAYILDTSTQRTRQYGIGSALPGGARITEIAERVVLLLNGGQPEYLELEAESAVGARPPEEHAVSFRTPEPLAGLEGVAQGIHRVGGNRYEIDRSVVDQLFSNASLFSMSSRVATATIDGRPDGAKIFPGVGSLPTLLGFFSGDTIKTVNGQAVTSDKLGEEIFSRLRQNGSITLSFDRHGVGITHEYLMR